MANAIHGLVAVAVAAAGCGGQVGEETGRCEIVSRAPLTMHEVSPLGFSPGQLLDATAGDHAGSVAWTNGGATEFAVGVAYRDGTAEFQHRDWVGDDRGLELEALGCDDVVAIGVDVAVATADGALDEAWVLDATTATADAIAIAVELDELAGTLSIESYAPPGEWTELRAWLELSVGASGPAGAIRGLAAGDDGDDAFADSFDIAVIGDASD